MAGSLAQIKKTFAPMKNSPAPLLGSILGISLPVTALLLGAATPTQALPPHTPSPREARVAAALPSPPRAAQESGDTYLRDVQPIFMGKCVRCHNAESRMLPNWLDYKTAFRDRVEIKRRVWDSWKGEYYKQPMPAGDGPECQAMTPADRERIKDWVETGAVLGTPPDQSPLHSRAELMAQGRHLFTTVCALCHQPDAQGIPNKFPPLAGSDFLNADKDRAIGILLHGRQGEIVVNGKTFNNSMPMFPLSDQDIAAALTYIYSSFGNSGKTVSPAEVKALRAEKYEPTPVHGTEVAHAPAQKSEFE